MGDAKAKPDNRWGTYLDRLTSRPGWNIQRLATASGVARQTISNWINGNSSQEGIKLETILAIAKGSGDDPINVFIAAADLVESEPEDREIGLIWKSDLPQDEKERQIQRIADRRLRDEETRIAETQEILRVHTKAS